jgi:hypothetical protein
LVGLRARTGSTAPVTVVGHERFRCGNRLFWRPQDPARLIENGQLAPRLVPVPTLRRHRVVRRRSEQPRLDCVPVVLHPCIHRGPVQGQMIEEQRVSRLEDRTHDGAGGNLLSNMRLHALVGKRPVTTRNELVQPTSDDVEAGSVVAAVCE